MELALAGTGSFDFVPVGETTTAELKGNWPHPSFGGNYLPRSREVAKDGFSARWATTALASNAAGDPVKAGADGFEVRLIDPVDIYRQALRAVKYGVLFIVLSFAAFFMFEHLRTLPIHPIQYLLVGLAQAVFFLLLTSLSEHIAFPLAYLAVHPCSLGGGIDRPDRRLSRGDPARLVARPRLRRRADDPVRRALRHPALGTERAAPRLAAALPRARRPDARHAQDRLVSPRQIRRGRRRLMLTLKSPLRKALWIDNQGLAA